MHVKNERRPVSRILSSRSFIWSADCSAALAAYPQTLETGSFIVCLFGIAPGGVCRACAVTGVSGGLLHHRFTLTLSGGLFSVALSLAHTRLMLSVTLPCGVRTFLPCFCTGDRAAFFRGYNYTMSDFLQEYLTCNHKRE